MLAVEMFYERERPTGVCEPRPDRPKVRGPQTSDAVEVRLDARDGRCGERRPLLAIPVKDQGLRTAGRRALDADGPRVRGRDSGHAVELVAVSRVGRRGDAPRFSVPVLGEGGAQSARRCGRSDGPYVARRHGGDVEEIVVRGRILARYGLPRTRGVSRGRGREERPDGGQTARNAKGDAAKAHPGASAAGIGHGEILPSVKRPAPGKGASDWAPLRSASRIPALVTCPIVATKPDPTGLLAYTPVAEHCSVS